MPLGEDGQKQPDLIGSRLHHPPCQLDALLAVERAEAQRPSRRQTEQGIHCLGELRRQKAKRVRIERTDAPGDAFQGPDPQVRRLIGLAAETEQRGIEAGEIARLGRGDHRAPDIGIRVGQGESQSLDPRWRKRPESRLSHRIDQAPPRRRRSLEARDGLSRDLLNGRFSTHLDQHFAQRAFLV